MLGLAKQRTKDFRSDPKRGISNILTQKNNKSHIQCYDRKICGHYKSKCKARRHNKRSF